jgi:hypothetical protein
VGWWVTSDSRDRYRVLRTAEGWFGPRKVRQTVTGRQAPTREIAWSHRRGIRDAPWRRLVGWIGAWQKATSDLVAHGKAPHNGVQVTHPATITVERGA